MRNPKDTKKDIMRFSACVVAVACLYVAIPRVDSDSNTNFPDIILTNGRVADPEAQTAVAFVRATAEQHILETFADAEDDPGLDEFLTTFFCNACSRNCLILTPRCAAGQLRNRQAVEIYREMYPHIEV